MSHRSLYWARCVEDVELPPRLSCGSWPHQVARRIADAVGVGHIKWRAASLIARRMIARLQQRALATLWGAQHR